MRQVCVYVHGHLHTHVRYKLTHKFTLIYIYINTACIPGHSENADSTGHRSERIGEVLLGEQIAESSTLHTGLDGDGCVCMCVFVYVCVKGFLASK